MSAHTTIFPRQSVPALSVPTVGGGGWTLGDQSPENFTMIVFYRGYHCPLCARYLGDLDRKLEKFAEKGVTAIAISDDSSLNAPVRSDSEGGEWMDWLVDETEDQETALGKSQELERRRDFLKTAMKGLNEREKRIFSARRLSEDTITLEDLSSEFGVSRERIRQIEVRAFEKVQKAVQKSAAQAEMQLAQ